MALANTIDTSREVGARFFFNSDLNSNIFAQRNQSQSMKESHMIRDGFG